MQLSLPASRPSSIVGPPIPRLPSILTPSTSGVIIPCGEIFLWHRGSSGFPLKSWNFPFQESAKSRRIMLTKWRFQTLQSIWRFKMWSHVTLPNIHIYPQRNRNSRRTTWKRNQTVRYCSAFACSARVLFIFWIFLHFRDSVSPFFKWFRHSANKLHLL